MNTKKFERQNEGEGWTEKESRRIFDKVIESIEERTAKILKVWFGEGLEFQVQAERVEDGNENRIRVVMLCSLNDTEFQISKSSLFHEGYDLVDDVPVSDETADKLWVKKYRVVRRA